MSALFYGCTTVCLSALPALTHRLSITSTYRIDISHSVVVTVVKNNSSSSRCCCYGCCWLWWL